jgi:plastocyanin
MEQRTTKSHRQIKVAFDPAVIKRQLLYYYAVFFLIAVVAFVIAGLQLAYASQSVTVIKMLDMPVSFEPELVTIKAGDTVEWDNVGNEVHHATNDASIVIKAGDAESPKGAELFDSGFLRPGETFTHTFTVPGVYKYACVVHEAKGMVGEIVVK